MYNLKGNDYHEFLDKELTNIIFKNEQALQLVFSELFANIRMHSSKAIGAVSLAIISGKIVFCLCNLDITIKKT